ncbi:hypothetical protein HPB47_006879 [Ixodes persulcatus]|uniref:Uncharacterized protein n=1 Tax=Ixodes persulcatus TaxID=34615 RepID=A0AC60P9N3_IXOPE|nr:hypothetical protein HPB47_006879 [Ixodes persulcatus]
MSAGTNAHPALFRTPGVGRRSEVVTSHASKQCGDPSGRVPLESRLSRISSPPSPVLPAPCQGRAARHLLTRIPGWGCAPRGSCGDRGKGVGAHVNGSWWARAWWGRGYKKGSGTREVLFGNGGLDSACGGDDRDDDEDDEDNRG